MEVLKNILEFYWLALVLGWLASSFLAFTHIVTTKRDVRAAIGWSGIVWLAPYFGPLSYFLFGINRIERKAARFIEFQGKTASADRDKKAKSQLSAPLMKRPEIKAHVALMDKVSDFAFVAGNSIKPLQNGGQTFTAMIKAINSAKKTIGFETYIFDHDKAGREFVKALAGAVKRGVEVRVLVDTIGAFYSFPQIIRVLKKNGVPVVRFNKSLVPWRMTYLNLRNHRKILVVDGKIGFTGGINIREGNFQMSHGKKVIRDLHFSLKGPIVRQLSRVFIMDWAFASDEDLDQPLWCPEIKTKAGSAFARGIADGPDGDVKKTRWAIFSALSMAQKSVTIMTPYFLPDRVLVSALNQAALRGVRVEILLPEENNLKYVHWAAQSQYGQVLEGGCNIFHSPGPFDHGKVMVIDGAWVLLGSTNWDPRSLRLNFEFNVECFDRAFAREIETLVREKLAKAKAITMSEVKARSKLRRAFLGLMWLFTPYL